MFVVLSAVPTLILSGARVGGGAFMSCNYCINRTPFLSAASPSTVFPFSRSCATLSSEAACDSVFSVTRRRGEGKMERGENRHAGRSLHNRTGVTCSRSQPHTNKQFLELNHNICAIYYVRRQYVACSGEVKTKNKKIGAIFVHSCKARKEMRKQESVTMML